MSWSAIVAILVAVAFTAWIIYLALGELLLEGAAQSILTGGREPGESLMGVGCLGLVLAAFGAIVYFACL